MASNEELTRKQRRDRSRAERKAAEEAVATDAARRRRLAQLGAVVTVVVLVLVGVVIVTGGGSRSGLGGGSRLREAAAVSSLLAGTTQRATVLGSPTAPVTMRYFGDLECSACRAFTLGALPEIIHRWVRSGRLKIEYRSLETATREPATFRTQQVAMLAAGRQDKAWNFIELFYHEQGEEGSGYVTESYLQGLAKEIPRFDLAKWMADRRDQRFASQLTADAQAANGSGMTSTPGFLIGKSGGTTEELRIHLAQRPLGFRYGDRRRTEG